MRTSRVCFLGESAAGKSALMQAMTGKGRGVASGPTIGVDYATETINCGARSVCVRYWDTAGQERFMCISRSYVRNADVVIIVQASDRDDRDCAEDLRRWIGMLPYHRQGANWPAVVFVRNKADLGQAVPGEHLARAMAELRCTRYYATVATQAGDPGLRLMHDSVRQLAVQATEKAPKRDEQTDYLYASTRTRRVNCCPS